MGYQVEPNVFSERVMAVSEAAYMAGLIDGEGSIMLIPRKGKGRQSHHFLAELSIGNSNLELLHRAVRLTGNGRIMVNKRPTSSNHKQVYSWQLAPRQVALVLPQVLPYLIAKRRQAEIVLRFLALRGAGPTAINGNPRLHDADIPEALALHAELKQLNRRGLTEPEALEFRLREAVERSDRRCSEEGCSDRCYRGQEQCYKHWLHRREPVLRTCEECGIEMDAILPRRRFCSVLCKNQNGYQRRKAAAAPKEEAEN